MRSCCIPGADGDLAVRVLANGSLDWRRVLCLATANGVLPMLCRRLVGAEGLPAPVGRALALHARANAGRVLALAGELVQVLDLLEAGGVAAIAFKGPVLARRIYGDISLRQIVDLDVLVSPHQAAAARDLLRRRGYVEQTHLTGPKGETEYAFRMVRAERSVVVELHWAFTLDLFGIDLGLEDVRRRCERVDFAGRRLPCLHASDLLLVLALHLGKHCWEEHLRLCWVCDVAQLLRVTDSGVWQEALCRARRLGCLRMVHLAVALARHLLPGPLPAPLAESLERDPEADRLAARAMAWPMRERQSAPAFDFDVFLRRTAIYMALRERPRDRLRYGVHYLSFGLRWVLRPNAEDRAWLPLPAAARWAYYLLRPARLLSKHRRRLAHQAARLVRAAAGRDSPAPNAIARLT